MRDNHDKVETMTMTTVSDARVAYQDLDEFHDEIFVRQHVRGSSR